MKNENLKTVINYNIPDNASCPNCLRYNAMFPTMEEHYACIGCGHRAFVRTMKAGDRVKVSRPKFRDHTWEGKEGVLLGFTGREGVHFTNPGGFARVHLDGDFETSNVLVHPESLEVIQ